MLGRQRLPGARPGQLPRGDLRLRRSDYDRADLARWACEIRGHGFREAFVFFKHEDEGAGPRMAADFIAVSEETGAPRRARATKGEADRDAG